MGKAGRRWGARLNSVPAEAAGRRGSGPTRRLRAASRAIEPPGLPRDRLRAVAWVAAGPRSPALVGARAPRARHRGDALLGTSRDVPAIFDKGIEHTAAFIAVTFLWPRRPGRSAASTDGEVSGRARRSCCCWSSPLLLWRRADGSTLILLHRHVAGAVGAGCIGKHGLPSEAVLSRTVRGPGRLDRVRDDWHLRQPNDRRRATVPMTEAAASESRPGCAGVRGEGRPAFTWIATGARRRVTSTASDRPDSVPLVDRSTSSSAALGVGSAGGRFSRQPARLHRRHAVGGWSRVAGRTISVAGDAAPPGLFRRGTGRRRDHLQPAAQGRREANRRVAWRVHELISAASISSSNESMEQHAPS